MGMMEDGAKDMLDVTSCGMKCSTGPQVEPVADLREAEGQLNKESCLQDKERTSSGEAVCKTYSGTPSGNGRTSSGGEWKEKALDGSVVTGLPEIGDYIGYEVPPCELSTPIRDLCSIETAFEEFKNRTSSRGLAFANEDMTAYDDFEGVTHFYSFDIAMERALINNMVYQFMNTSTAWLFASFIGDLIPKYGLNNCFLASKIPAKMFGSGEGHCCYIYVKNNWKIIKHKHDTTILHKLQCPTKNGVASSSEYIFNGKIEVNKFNEPTSTLDLIKLSKLPLYTQYLWYLNKINKMTKPVVTRSYSDYNLGFSNKLRENLCKERDELIEKLATCDEKTSKHYRKLLKTHIKTHFNTHNTFP